jgi:hypothetical protein
MVNFRWTTIKSKPFLKVLKISTINWIKLCFQWKILQFAWLIIEIMNHFCKLIPYCTVRIANHIFCQYIFKL